MTLAERFPNCDIYIGSGGANLHHPPGMCRLEALLRACVYPRFTSMPGVGDVGLPKNAPTPDPGSVTVVLHGIPVGDETSFTTLPAPSSCSTSLEDGWDMAFQKHGSRGTFTFTERVAA